MNYLQKVIAFVENKKCVAQLEILGQTLMKAGIGFPCFTGNHIMDSQLVINCGILPGEQHRDEDARLWITDSARWAHSLKMQGEAVLVLLHEDNGNQDFSGILHACENPQELDAEYIIRVFQRCRGIPWDIAETKRCFIRETTEEDVEAFFEIYENPQITRYMEGLYPTVEKEKQYINEYIENVYGFLGFGIWTIIKKDTDEVIGRAGFSYRDGYEDPEIGFVIGGNWQRNGYAGEVCSTLLDLAKEELGFSKVNAFVRLGNAASLALCEKLGFTKVGETVINAEQHWHLQKKLH